LIHAKKQVNHAKKQVKKARIHRHRHRHSRRHRHRHSRRHRHRHSRRHRHRNSLEFRHKHSKKATYVYGHLRSPVKLSKEEFNKQRNERIRNMMNTYQKHLSSGYAKQIYLNALKESNDVIFEAQLDSETAAQNEINAQNNAMEERKKLILAKINFKKHPTPENKKALENSRAHYKNLKNELKKSKKNAKKKQRNF